MKYLRTVSTRQLLAAIAGLVVAVGGGTAIALAAAGTGPVPPRKPLPQAVHDALAAPSVRGITASITFTNHLIDSSDIQGSDPILTGATGRLWLSGDHRLRLELQSDSGEDAQVVVNGNSFWAYDPSARTVYEGTLPQERQRQRHPATDRVPTVARIQNELQRLAQHLTISGAQPADVAGQPAYTVSVSPKHDGGLLGSAQLAWDAVRGVPLRVAVFAHNSTEPVLELKATDISYAAVPASVFSISPPGGTKVVRVSAPREPAAALAHARHARRHHETHGVTAVSRRLRFTLVAPRQLVGLPRRSVTLLDWGGQPAAAVTYGQNLGGVAVIEQRVTGSQTPAGRGSGHDRHGLALPTVSINGATGQELDTALGTMVRFTRAGVRYTVIGSVPPAAADAAARAL